MEPTVAACAKMSAHPLEFLGPRPDDSKTIVLSVFARLASARDLGFGQQQLESPLQRAQIVRHVVEFSDHLGIAEIACSRIARCDGTDMPCPARQRLGAHHYRDRIEAFGRLASRNALVIGYERQSNVSRSPSPAR
jgi:hypothetical protein